MMPAVPDIGQLFLKLGSQAFVSGNSLRIQQLREEKEDINCNLGNVSILHRSNGRNTFKVTVETGLGKVELQHGTVR